jgi:hypothetical protein
MRRQGWTLEFLAIAAVGALITVWAFRNEPRSNTFVLEQNGTRLVPEPPEKSFEDKLVDWAHHFGPELLILAFGAGVIDYRVERDRERERERREKELRRTTARLRFVESLRVLLRYIEDNNAFLTGDSIMTLDNEADILRASLESAREVLRCDERRLFDEVIKAADELLGPARANPIAADEWIMAGVRLRLELLKAAAASPPQVTDNDCKIFAALEDQARAALRSGRAVYDPSSTANVQFASATTDDLTDFINALKARTPAVPNQIIDPLEKYLVDLKGLFKVKYEILTAAAGFRAQYGELREATWQVSPPYAV